MKQPTIALKRINQLLHCWSSGNESPAASYAAIHVIIGQLKLICENKDVTEAIDSQLDAVIFHTNAMFNADDNEGQDFKYHLSHALNAIAAVSPLLH